MEKIVSMTAKEIDKEFTPAKIKAMVKKAKVSKDDNPFTPEEWWAKAKYPNRGRPRLREYVEKGITAGLL